MKEKTNISDIVEKFIPESGTEQFIKKTPVNCDCGESVGFLLKNEEGETIAKIVKCDNCYYSSAYTDRL